MFKVLITGAFGNVGRSAVAACLEKGDSVTILETGGSRSRRLSSSLGSTWAKTEGGQKNPLRILLGDVRDPVLAHEAVAGQDAVIHLAALIPPAADLRPELARSINVGGTANLLQAIAELGGAKPRAVESGDVGLDLPIPRFVLASSIAAYGDRLRDYWIRTTDKLESCQGDAYGASKIEAEELVRQSGLPFSILRLTYIVWRKKLQMDPLMFHMPLGTKIEICHTEDTGRAFAEAARAEGALGKTLNIGGGASCRTTYRDYIDAMLRLFGLGGLSFLPDAAFAAGGFHCGWYADSDEAEGILGFRKKSLADYYVEVAEEARWLQLGTAIAGPAIKARLRAASEFLSRVKAARR